MPDCEEEIIVEDIHGNPNEVSRIKAKLAKIHGTKKSRILPKQVRQDLDEI